MKGWFPKLYNRTIVLLEKKSGIEFEPLGTGFFIKTEYREPFLVTAKHVLEDILDDDIVVRYTDRNGKSVRLPYTGQKAFGCRWYSHPTEDIAISPYLRTIDHPIVTIDKSILAKYDEIDQGDETFFIGYPFHVIENYYRNKWDVIKPVVGLGIIASILGNNKILIEGNIFPGFSGGPVSLKPTGLRYEEGKGFTLGGGTITKVIGLITHYIYCPTKNKEGKIVYSENAGHAEVVSIECVHELLNSEEFKSSLKEIKIGVDKEVFKPINKS